MFIFQTKPKTKRLHAVPIFACVEWYPMHIVLCFWFVFRRLSTLCYQFLWISNFWLPVQYSLTCIYNRKWNSALIIRYFGCSLKWPDWKVTIIFRFFPKMFEMTTEKSVSCRWQIYFEITKCCHSCRSIQQKAGKILQIPLRQGGVHKAKKTSGSLCSKLEVFICRHVVYVPKSSTTFREILICVIFRPRDMQEYYAIIALHWVRYNVLWSTAKQYWPRPKTAVNIAFQCSITNHIAQNEVL
jgi:hypothetical protein